MAPTPAKEPVHTVSNYKAQMWRLNHRGIEDKILILTTNNFPTDTNKRSLQPCWSFLFGFIRIYGNHIIEM